MAAEGFVVCERLLLGSGRRRIPELGVDRPLARGVVELQRRRADLLGS
jgi:hypothetical protein